MNDERINDASKKDSAWQYLQEIGVSERHFNEIESKYRSLASTWLLAAFAGMGSVALLPFGLGALLAGCEIALARMIGAMLALATICGSAVLWKRSRNAWLLEEVGKLEEPATHAG